jgi:spore protease
MDVRTDLAIEARELAGDVKTELKGIKVTTKEIEEIEMVITKVEVLDGQGERTINKPIGSYITIECDELRYHAIDNKKDIVLAVANELKNIIDFKNKAVLVVGLGNQNITPDSLGPKVVGNLIVTRHLFEELDGIEDEMIQPLSSLAPGVMGQTGMETVEIIKGVVDTIKPDIVIAIDALASRKTSRVNSTIQIADTGVNPGSGVGNFRKKLNKETLGIDVIAIGVPTVVDAATIVNDTIEELFAKIKNHTDHEAKILDTITEMSDEEKYQLIKEVLNPGNMFVTPKEIDEVIDRISDIIGAAINMTVHYKLGYDEIKSWLS